MNISKEILIIRELLNLTQTELAEEIGVSFETINRWEANLNDVEDRNVEKVYNYAFLKGIYFNKIYELLLNEEHKNSKNVVLFHGSKGVILEKIDFKYSKINNDFGTGFYLGETFKQAATYIANSKSSNVYAFKLYLNELKISKFYVNKEWMIAIAYFRGWINEYKDHPIVVDIINKVNESDIVIAPIADNRMFDIVSEFVRGEITDLQCEHALAATNLGFQYVIKSKKALSNLSLLRKCYVSNNEREKLFKERLDMNDLGKDKVKVARIEYRGKGQYIDELLK